MKFRSGIAALVTFTAMAVKVHGNLIVNGNFTDGLNGADGWTVTGDTVENGMTVGGPGFVNGDFTGSAQWTIGQSIDTTPGAQYEISFALMGGSHAIPPYLAPLTLDFGGFTTTISFGDFVPVVTAGQTNSWYMPLQYYEFMVSPTQLKCWLGFTTTEDLDVWNLHLGDVRVEAVPDGSSTALLLILAGGFLAAIRRYYRPQRD